MVPYAFTDAYHKTDPIMPRWVMVIPIPYIPSCRLYDKSKG